ncbi:hypothetical protein HAX54_001500 [Datura stramonium]|uniref:Uncharacterized protein n=1 Tax=Datura stramonium TaxID=4076 RepID=A0ABS8WT60_DATST|nr:hypothetical protein [Datura stramonium]
MFFNNRGDLVNTQAVLTKILVIKVKEIKVGTTIGTTIMIGPGRCIGTKVHLINRDAPKMTEWGLRTSAAEVQSPEETLAQQGSRHDESNYENADFTYKSQRDAGVHTQTSMPHTLGHGCVQWRNAEDPS